MFDKLKAMFSRKKPEQPKAAYVPPTMPRRTYASQPPAQRAAPSETKRDDINDLLNPLNPMGLTSPISPLNPISPLWHGNSSASTSDCGASSSSSSYDSGSSSSSYDNGSSSSSSCDSGSSW